MCSISIIAFVLDTLLKLHMVTAGKGMFQVGKCELSMTVTVGVSRFEYQEVSTRDMALMMAAMTTPSQKQRSFRLISGRVI